VTTFYIELYSSFFGAVAPKTSAEGQQINGIFVVFAFFYQS
jgi:hypothetical protein